MQLLKGQLIVLRALEPEDLETLYAWENNSNVWHLSNTITPYSKHLLRDYIYNTQYDIFTAKQLRLMICKDNLPVGCIDLYDFRWMVLADCVGRDWIFHHIYDHVLL